MKVDDNSGEADLGMQKVTWESTGSGRNVSKERYDVIDVRTIVKAVFLQPHPVEEETWFYNHFV